MGSLAELSELVGTDVTHVDPHRPAIDDHRTGAAHALAATDMHAGGADFTAQKITQKTSRSDRGGDEAAVDGHGQG